MYLFKISPIVLFSVIIFSSCSEVDMSKVNKKDNYIENEIWDPIILLSRGTK